MDLLWGRLIHKLGQGRLIQGQIIAAFGVGIVEGNRCWGFWHIAQQILRLSLQETLWTVKSRCLCDRTDWCLASVLIVHESKPWTQTGTPHNQLTRTCLRDLRICTGSKGACLRCGSSAVILSARQEGCTVRLRIEYDDREEQNPYKGGDAQA